MSLIEWAEHLSAHQLDVIRTFSSLLVSIFGVISTVSVIYSRLAFKNSRQAKDATQLTKWVDGKLHTVSVAEIANRIHGDTADLAKLPNIVHGEIHSEINDLVNDPRTGPQIRIHGRRRLDTEPVVHSPENRPTDDESKYS